MTASVRTIGVVGAGAIGRTVCADFVLHGFRVVLVDQAPEQFDRAREVLTEAVRFGPALRPQLPRLDVDEALAAVEYTTDLGRLSGCELVVENVSEHWPTKQQLYRRLDEVLAPGTILAVNTSSIPIGKLAAETSRPDAVIGVHFMNPAYAITSVEVMRGAATSEDCLRRTTGILAELGKEPIVVGDFPGFVSNRISHLFFNEACRVVEEHGVEPQVVDQIFRKCFGHRMGPLETADLIGLDTVALTLDALRENTGDERFRCSDLLRGMVAEGRVGMKSGNGFYRY
jgi:3-hydroxybutyryl-CoA dehydrogenase